MKSILFSILFLLVPKLCISQLSANDKKVYLDSTWNETTQDNYTYYRIIKNYYLDKDLYKINDFYKSGVLQMEGVSLTKDGSLKEGKFVFYYENGNKKAMTNYIKSQPNGKCYEWYENGNKKLEGEYIKNEKTIFGVLKVFQFWNSKYIQTVVDGNGDYEEVSVNYFTTGKIKDGFKDGIWEGYDKKIGCKFSENYNNQKLISGVSIDSNKVEHNYTEIEMRPHPQKGIQHLAEYIGRTFVTPNVQGLKGFIYVSFVIETDGSVSDIKVLKDVGYGTGASIMRVVSPYKGWISGKQRGVKVRSTFIFPISIKSAN